MAKSKPAVDDGADLLALRDENAALRARLAVYEPPYVPLEFPKALHRTVKGDEGEVVESVTVVDADDEERQKAEGFA